MGVARNAAKWRNMQQNQETDMDKAVVYLLLFVGGLISFGVVWLFIPIYAVIDAWASSRVSRRTTYSHSHRVNYR